MKPDNNNVDNDLLHMYILHRKNPIHLRDYDMYMNILKSKVACHIKEKLILNGQAL